MRSGTRWKASVISLSKAAKSASFLKSRILSLTSVGCGGVECGEFSGAAGRVQRMLIDGRIAGVVERRVSLDEAKEGLRNYVENMTAGNVLITPHGERNNDSRL